MHKERSTLFPWHVEKRNVFSYMVMVSVLVTVISCDLEKYSIYHTGIINFNIRLHASDQQNPITADKLLSEICDEAGITFIDVSVYNSDGTKLITDRLEPCPSHAMTLSDVPAGKHRTIVVLCKNGNGNVLYRGEQIDVNVRLGETVYAGKIECRSFIPKHVVPPSISYGELKIQIDAVQGAEEYQFIISTSPDLRDYSLYTTADTTFLSFGYLDDTTYYWQINAIDTDGNVGTTPEIFVADPENVDNDSDGYSEEMGDCRDDDYNISPDAAEQCNNMDDNCNNRIDEGLIRETTCGVGKCTGNSGQEVCQAGIWRENTCNPYQGAVAEKCNGVDDDCDGNIDNGIECFCVAGEKREVVCGVGACFGNTGIQNCIDGKWSDSTCDPNDGAKPEICNNIDDDCDGVTDESLVRKVTCGKGACKGTPGEEICVSGEWVVFCDPISRASTEICDNIDNDCDGAIDEFLFKDTSCGTGICKQNTGIQICKAGDWYDSCDPLDGYLPETCNNQDDDCDGEIDNDLDCKCIDGETRVTSCGKGVCANNTGRQSCIGGKWSGDTCDPYEGAVDEMCNDIDDDCDSLIDEDLSRTTLCGTGECAGNTGTEICSAGVWGGDTCNPFEGSSAEVCDNLDNDCDGAVDEQLTRKTTCGVGQCFGNTGVETCNHGKWEQDTCDPFRGAASEICDNMDNDCNGRIDDDLTRMTICGTGECARTGTEKCTMGVWSDDTCVAGEPAEEVCDNADNDCDGYIDDDLKRPTTCGKGVCLRTGVETCKAGLWQENTCVPGTAAVVETCDGLDNDCNGYVDDNLFQPTDCGVGACSGNTGAKVCVDGVWQENTCDPFDGASPEICDNIDNDCNGYVDDGLIRLTTCGTGACAGNIGVETCTAGIWGEDTCKPFDRASDEECDNIDNDCDGHIDENLHLSTTCGVGACAGNTGEKICSNGKWGQDTCQPLKGAQTEICDNIDNDCNGLIDDGVCNDYYIRPSGNDDPPGDGSKEEPWQTIRHAIDTIAGLKKDHAVIHLSAGTYFQKDDVILDGWLTLKGGWNTDFSKRWDFGRKGLNPTSAFETVINGDVSSEWVERYIVADGKGAKLTIEGVSIRNNGGIRNVSSELTVEYCRFRDNHWYSLENISPHPVSVRNCQFIENVWGGIFNTANSTIDVSASTFKNNEVLVGGAVIYNDPYATTDISDCLFEGNRAENGRGAAIYIGREAAVTVTSCRFFGNSVSGGGHGGAIYIDMASPQIIGCTFSKNHASKPLCDSCEANGGAIYNVSAAADITNCIFVGNYAYSFGGAIYNKNSSPRIINCTFYGNFVPSHTYFSNGSGGAIYNLNAAPRIINTILWGNIAPKSGNQMSSMSESLPLVSYSDINEDGYEGERGNIRIDPLLDENQHLKIESACIDAGDSHAAPRSDIDGDIRPQGHKPDIGADEFFFSDGYDIFGID